MSMIGSFTTRCSSIQTDDSCMAYRGRLPNSELLVSQLHEALSKSEAKPCSAAPPMKDVLERHPAFAQLMAKSPALRSVIERGAEELLPSHLDKSNGVLSAHVLWTVCNFVWQGIGVILEDLGRKIPNDTTGQSAQFRFLMQNNNDLRDQLAVCRRDYLRELTELRERCRRIEPCAEEALKKLMKEEPVMFFEPLDFILEDSTKQFVCETVEEKLRLLMLKGWGKLEDSDKRIENLEAEVAKLRAELDATAACVTPPAQEKDIVDKSVFSKVLLDDLRPLETDKDLASTRCSTAMTNRSVGSSLGFSPVDSPRGDNTSSMSSSRCGTAMTTDSVNGGECQECLALRSKLEKLCSHLKENVGQQVVDDALAHAGLCASQEMHEQKKSKPRKLVRATAFDRLYNDARRRLNKLRDNTDEVHALQAAEITSCSLVAKSTRVKKKVDQVKNLHSRAVASAFALQNAFDSFHAENCKTMDTEGEDGDRCVEASVCCSDGSQESLSGGLSDGVVPLDLAKQMPEGEGKTSHCVSECEKRIYAVHAQAQYRMQRIREQVAHIRSLQTTEIDHCSVVARNDITENRLESLRSLHCQFLTSSSVFQENLETLHDHVTRSSGKEADEAAPNYTAAVEDADPTPLVQSSLGSAASAGRAIDAMKVCEAHSQVSSTSSQERGRPCPRATLLSQPEWQDALPRMRALHPTAFVQPLLLEDARSRGPTTGLNSWGDHLEFVKAHSCSPEKNKKEVHPMHFGEHYASRKLGNSHGNSPEKVKKVFDFVSIEDGSAFVKAHSSSPEKNRRTVDSSSFGDDSVFMKAHSNSPEKNKKVVDSSSFGEDLVLMKTHSNSPEKKKKVVDSSSFGEDAVFMKAHSGSPGKKKKQGDQHLFEDRSILVKSWLSHSSSPDRRSKRVFSGAAQLDSLPIAPYMEDISPLACRGRGASACALLRCPSSPLTHGSKACASSHTLTRASHSLPSL